VNVAPLPAGLGITLKDGVTVDDLSMEMRSKLSDVSDAIGEPFTIVSGTEGKHAKGPMSHEKGKGVDIRTNHLKGTKGKAKGDAWIQRLKQVKGLNVIDERLPGSSKNWNGPHIHINVLK
jgi:hypothetical protein